MQVIQSALVFSWVQLSEVAQNLLLILCPKMVNTKGNSFFNYEFESISSIKGFHICAFPNLTLCQNESILHVIHKFPRHTIFVADKYRHLKDTKFCIRLLVKFHDNIMCQQSALYIDFLSPKIVVICKPKVLDFNRDRVNIKDALSVGYVLWKLQLNCVSNKKKTTVN